MNQSPIIIEAGMEFNGWYVERLVMKTPLSELWKVRNTLPGLDQHAALKVIAEELMQNPEMMLRFVEEIKILSALRLEHVPPSIGYFPVTPRYAVLTRWIDGMTLADRIDESPGGMEVEEIVRLSLPILRTLDQLHRLNAQLIHRDIKPLNVMIEKTGRPFLIDFGIALVRGNTRLSRAGQVIGTPEYMAPEMIQRADEISYAVDIYAYGIMLFEMLTGHPPFTSEVADSMVKLQEIQHQHIYSTPHLVGDFRAGVPDDLEYIVQKAIEKNPAKRWASCGEMADELARLIESKPLPPPPPPRPGLGTSGTGPSSGPNPMVFAPTPQPHFAAADVTPPAPPSSARGISKWFALLSSPGVAVISALPYMSWLVDHMDHPLDSTNPQLLLAAAVGAAVSFAAYLHTLYRAWSAIQDAETLTTPGAVVREHFFFPWTLVAVWRYFAGYGDHYNRYLERHELDVPEIESLAANFFVILPFLLFLAPFVEGNSAKVLLVIGVIFVQLFLFAMMIARMCDAINDIYDVQAPAGEALEASAP